MTYAGAFKAPGTGLNLAQRSPSAFFRTVVSATLALLVAIVLNAGEGLAFQGPAVHYEEFTLANGLRVVVIPNHRAPIVTHSIWYKVGSAVEAPGKTGLAHFLEHLMFKGTRKYPAGEYDRLMAENGADQNAFTTSDYTSFYQRIASAKLELVMDLESDRMKNLVLTDANVLPEREVVKQERLQRIESEPTGAFWEELSARLYGEHPYSRPVIGYMADVEKLTRQDALDFYHTYYQPSNAVVIVAGDAEPSEVRRLAEKYYGPLANSGPVPERHIDPPVLLQREPLEATSPQAQSSFVARSYLAPASSGKDWRDSLALSFLAAIVGWGEDSRLSEILVFKQGLASQVGANMEADTVDDGIISFYAVPNPGMKLEDVEAALLRTIEEVRRNGVTEAELDRARTRAFNALVYQLDRPAEFLRAAGVAAMTGATTKEAFDTAPWNEITTADVQRAAQKYLSPDRAVTGRFLKPDATVAAQVSP